MIYKTIKRLFDILISTIVIFTLSPIVFFIALSIKINSPGEIFYHGIRAGKGVINFSILKFITMVSDSESKGGFSTALNDYRLTSIGRFLRKYKLDELPQFINVIKGGMSLVGLRPQVLYYTDQYKGELKLILSVWPVLHSTNTNNDIVKNANYGSTVKAEDSIARARGIEEVYAMNANKREELGRNGKKNILEHFTYENLAKECEKLF
jgi:lipopolysaccharide/colanic/teichoic acid biosynthesis glycosyltransferase